MNALIRKEVQLLVPAWLAALVLAVMPLCLITNPTDFGGWGLFVLLFWMGTLLLGVSSFGREISAATFAQLLAQPVSRQRLWRIKTLVLAVAMLSAFVAYYVTWNVRLVGTIKLPTWWWAHPVFESVNVGSNLAMAGIMALTAFAGGLWSTLLLRQYLAAFLVTLLTPWLVVLPANLLTERIAGASGQINLVVGCVVLGVYALLGFLLARWLFLKSQDVAWTGGVIALPRILGRRTAGSALSPKPVRGQVTALLRKEFHFQQVSLIFAGLLLVLHIAMLFAQKWTAWPKDSMWTFVFEAFWLFWFVLPWLIGCMAVAEERRLGTLAPQLCLPASRVKQFAVKVLMVVVFALGLGAVPVWLMDWWGIVIGMKSSGATTSPDGFLAVSGAAVGIAMVGFYASSLARNFLQALAASFGIWGLIALINYWLFRPATIGGIVLWDGPIGVLMAGVLAWLLSFSFLSWRGRGRMLLAVLGALLLWWIMPLVLPGLRSHRAYEYVFSLAGVSVGGGLILFVLVLAYQNFRLVNSYGAMWRKNLGVWFVGLAISSVLATAIYHRVWEIGARFEPPAGPARLSGDVRPTLTPIESNQGLFVLLPNGSLVAVRRQLPASDQVEDGGSNWVAIAKSLNYIVGIKADGSLWSLSWWGFKQPDGDVIPAVTNNWKDFGRQLRPTPLPITATRMDNETNWTSIASGHSHFLALKRDGTLWGWGENRKGELGTGLPEFFSAPVQLGTDLDWVFVSGFSSGSVAVKRDHSVWKWGQAFPVTERGIGKVYIGATPQKIATLPAGVLRIISTHYGDVFFCTDGTGWGLGQTGGNYLGTGNSNAHHADLAVPILTTLTKLWDNSRWTEAGDEFWNYVAGIQGDGSLWLQHSQDPRRSSWILPDPARLGTRTDWIALQTHYPYPSVVYALARDGTLCRFGAEYNFRTQLTRPTQRVTWSVNVLDAMQP